MLPSDRQGYLRRLPASEGILTVVSQILAGKREMALRQRRGCRGCRLLFCVDWKFGVRLVSVPRLWRDVGLVHDHVKIFYKFKASMFYIRP